MEKTKYKLEWKLRLLAFLMSRMTPMIELTPAEARASQSQGRDSDGIISRLMQNKIKLHAITNRLIEGRNGAIPIRIYRPSAATNLPVIVFFHGGGWVVCDLDTHDGICRQLAQDNGMVVVSVDYRLAPEHKYPAAAEDCYDTTLWVWENAAELGVDPDKVIVGGDSAGGNLAAVTTLMAREAGKPHIAFQLLIYPATDATMSHPSVKANQDAPILTKAMMDWFVGHYQRQPSDVQDPYFSPLRADDFSNLPPALVLTAEYDPLRDEGQAYAAKLLAAGSDVTVIDYPRMVHGFLSFASMASAGKPAFAHIQQALRPFTKIQPQEPQKSRTPMFAAAAAFAVGAGALLWAKRRSSA